MAVFRGESAAQLGAACLPRGVTRRPAVFATRDLPGKALARLARDAELHVWSEVSGPDPESLRAGAQSVDAGAVPPDTMRVFELPALSIAPGLTSADGMAYRVESDLPITAYQFQPLDNTSPVFSNDATLLFPTHVLDTDYTAITGDATLVAADQDAALAVPGVVLGIVGVGGIGYLFRSSLANGAMGRASTFLLTIVLVTVAIDRLSRRLQRGVRC